MEKELSELRDELGYIRLMRKVLAEGEYRMDRTGTGAYSLFGAQIRFDLSDYSLPLLTTKKVQTQSIIKELLWFLRGETNIKTLGCGIWDQWADEDGELGPIYGKQWRSWPGKLKAIGMFQGQPPIDQIAQVMKSLKEDPFSRRHIVTAWNPADLPDMALAPCHCLFQFFVREDQDGTRYLDCQLYQRSADLFLGVPFNIASYSILTMMMAKVLGYEPGEFVHTFGDVHIYENHIPMCVEQLDYYDENGIQDPPILELPKRKSIDDFKLSDFEIVDYSHGPFIPAPVAK